MTDRQELILQMFAKDKSMSIGRLCEKTGLSSTTAKREIAFRTNLLITAQVRLRLKLKNGIFFVILNRKSDPQTPVSHLSAERTRFELVIRLPVCRFSKPVDSATLPPLRMFWPNGCQTFRRYLDYKDTNFSCFPRILRKINAEVSMLMPRNHPHSGARGGDQRLGRTGDPVLSAA